jgi:hypothetical protein
MTNTKVAAAVSAPVRQALRGMGTRPGTAVDIVRAPTLTRPTLLSMFGRGRFSARLTTVSDLPDFRIPHAEKIEWMIETKGYAI